MTRDEFGDKYKLLKPLASGDGSSYTAEHRANGRGVLVHFLPPEAAGTAALLDRIDRLPPRERSKIIETLTVGTSTVVVTDFIELHGSFEQWLRAEPASQDIAASASAVFPAPSPPATRAGGGEFTQMFRSDDDHPPPNAAEGPPPQPATVRSGSFTALFQPPKPEADPALPAATTPSPTVPIRKVRVQTPVPSEPPPEAPPRPASPSATDVGSGPPVPSFRSPDLAPPRFQVPGATEPPAPASPAVPRGHQGFVLPTMAAPPSSLSPRERSAPPPASSDYTRILKGARDAAPDAPAPVSPAPAEPQGPAGIKSYLPFLVLLNVVLILATGLVVYFALKHH